jgi:23S rRNA pseudouridine1911/1915/1917 synthase
MEARTLAVAEASAHLRLDALLMEELRISRRYAQRLIARGAVRVDGVPAVKGVRLSAGAQVAIPALRHPSEGPLPDPDAPLAVLAEGDGLVAVAKPAGVPCHPLDFDTAGTVLNAFVARYPPARTTCAGSLEGALVHRLDTGTSGVLLLATRQDAHDATRAAFARGEVEKRYLARVHGVLASPRVVELSLCHAGPRMRVCARGGRRAITQLEVLRCDGGTTLLDVAIPTGVRHQIRATLAHLGHPIVGDVVYGSPRPLPGDGPRHLLHAASVRVGTFAATAPPPAALDPRVGVFILDTR